METEPMKLVDGEAVHRLLDYPGLVRALREAHRGAAPRSDAAVMDEPGGGDNKFVSLVAWAPRDVIAVKLVGVFPSNLSLDPPQPSVQGLVAVFDGATGAPVLAADGAALTFRKTAADSALGASFLARSDAEVLVVVGAGGLAPHVILAHASVRPTIRRVLIWNRTPERAASLARRMALGGVAIEAVTDLDEAVSRADVISCVTMSTAPLVKGALLKPGVHVDLIGAYLPTMREADDETIRRARIFVDTRVGMEGAGDLAQPVKRGLLAWSDIQADLYDLCTGRAEGRRTTDEITLFKNVGGGHLDLFTARYLSDRLREEG
jgi:ornithine cyclodeaminase/alanine dehydrogenase-like protein (mu-crystallin family)